MDPAHSSDLHIVMFPWFGLGHIMPFLHISNKLARKGHRISFLVPAKTQSKIQHFNRFPRLITFFPITVPHVDGLPVGAETTSDVPTPFYPLLIMTAMDRTERDVELLLLELKPHIVFFDVAYWIPKLACKLGIKTVYFLVLNLVMEGYLSGCARAEQEMSIPFEKLLLQPPSSFPDSSIKLHLHETRFFVRIKTQGLGIDIKLDDRLRIGRAECDVLVSKGCKEIEGPFVEFAERNIGKLMLLVGPVIPESPTNGLGLEDKWVNFLCGFEAGSVIYCGLGSETVLKKDQFQELLLGFELSGYPFLAALKPPFGTGTIEEALPDGFEGRVKGSGVVHGGWIQQQLILKHPSVGCYVTHCGYGSMMEGLVLNESCQLVMIPFVNDQIYNARLIANRLKAGVEVKRGEEDGFFTRESVCKAIRTVMEENYSEVGREIRANCSKLRELLLNKDTESSYIDDLIKKLQDLMS